MSQRIILWHDCRIASGYTIYSDTICRYCNERISLGDTPPVEVFVGGEHAQREGDRLWRIQQINWYREGQRL